MNFYKYILLLIIIFLGALSFAQPANDDCGSATTVSDLDGTCNTYDNTGATLDAAPSNLVGGCFDNANTSWFQFTAQGNQVDIDITSGVNKFNPDVVILGDTDGNICDGVNGFEVECNAITTGNTSNISVSGYPLTVGDTYWILVASGEDGSYDLCVDNPTNTPGDNCLSAEPFCTDNTQTFDAATNTTAVDNADYGCLLTQSNPKWFYLEVDQSGDITMDITNTNGNDIDYAIWGPVADVSTGCLTDIAANPPIDCSYSIAANETANITGATAGEIYIMVITNYDNTPTTISFSQSGGSGSTDCGITLPVNLISFDGYSHKTYNSLEWETASENNNSHFLVQHSVDGDNWELIDKKSGSGTTFTNSFYQVRHKNPAKKINYYRLVQVDYNGKREIHGPIAVDNLKDVRVDKIVNLMGQEVDSSYKGVVIIHYSNGETVKRIQ